MTIIQRQHKVCTRRCSTLTTCVAQCHLHHPYINSRYHGEHQVMVITMINLFLRRGTLCNQNFTYCLLILPPIPVLILPSCAAALPRRLFSPSGSPALALPRYHLSSGPSRRDSGGDMRNARWLHSALLVKEEPDRLRLLMKTLTAVIDSAIRVETH